MTPTAPPPPRTHWPRTPVPTRIADRAVLGAFRDPYEDGDWTVLCDAAEADRTFIIGRWRIAAQDRLETPRRFESAFKAILTFETERLAALQRASR